MEQRAGRARQPAPEALLAAPHGPFHLTQAFGKDFVCLVFGDGALPEAIAQLTAAGVGVLDIPPDADSLGQARQRRAGRRRRWLRAACCASGPTRPTAGAWS